MAEKPNPAPAAEPTPAPVEPAAPAEKTFTQAELDTIVAKRLAKAQKGMPSDEELTAFRAWKESQQTEKDRWDALTQERDTARTDLTAANARAEQLAREIVLYQKGVTDAEDVKLYSWRIGQLVTESKDFAAAADEYFAAHPPRGAVRVDVGGPLSGGKPAAMSLSDRIKAQIRGR